LLDLSYRRTAIERLFEVCTGQLPPGKSGWPVSRRDALQQRMPAWPLPGFRCTGGLCISTERPLARLGRLRW